MIARTYEEYRVNEILNRTKMFRNSFSDRKLNILISKEDAGYLANSPFFTISSTVDNAVKDSSKKLAKGLFKNDAKEFFGILEVASTIANEKIPVYLDLDLPPLEVRYNVMYEPKAKNTTEE
jgi:hypothetical protein